jgi:rubrerythrin
MRSSALKGIDWSELSGFSSGKEAAMRDRDIRKEVAETERLILKYYNRKRDAKPERKAAAKVRAKKWRDLNPEQRRAYERRRFKKSQKRKAQLRAAAKRYRDAERDRLKNQEFSCQVCGASWCVNPHIPRSKVRKYCGLGKCTM